MHFVQMKAKTDQSQDKKIWIYGNTFKMKQ